LLNVPDLLEMWKTRLGTVYDFARVCSANPFEHEAPTTPRELQDILEQNIKGLRVCIVGSGFSHGGHTLRTAAIRIDMKNLNKMALGTRRDQASIIVQAGATWHQVLEFLEHETSGVWSVAEMQSYANFSVGGSVSVNCHGRSTRFANIGDTILSMTVQLVDGGTPLVALPGSDLFRAVVGGYGGVAIIVDVELILVRNVLLERTETSGPSGAAGMLNALELAREPGMNMYNGVIYPGADTVIVHTCFRETDPGHDQKFPRLQPRPDPDQTMGSLAVGEFFVRRFPVLKQLRAWWKVTAADSRSPMVWRNWELGYDATELEPLMRWPTTSVLQEYFVPVDNAALFLIQLHGVIKLYGVNVLNISVRHIAATTQDTFLNYASPRDERMAVVLYINIWNTDNGLEHAKLWTQMLVDSVLHFGGTYYLPYLPLASVTQFKRAYPRVSDYCRVKRHYDPYGKLRNQFLDTYVLCDTD